MSGEVFIPAALTSIRVEREKGKKKKQEMTDVTQ
jgi:hypothetical protein